MNSNSTTMRNRAVREEERGAAVEVVMFAPSRNEKIANQRSPIPRAVQFLTGIPTTIGTARKTDVLVRYR
jgi:hypothetical protein